jgi:two-component system cell cycle sensor histidine kinase/response regulator CckA
VPVEITAAPILFDARHATLIVLRDTTERHRAEQALRESEERFRAIADYTYEWENWFGPEGKLLWVNPAVERVTGYTVQECLDMPDYPLAIIHEQDLAAMEALFRAATMRESGYNLQCRLRRKDGSVIWVETDWQPIYDSKGAGIGFRTSSRDVTGRVLRQMELNQMSTAVAQSANIIAFVSPGGFIQYVNPQFTRATGYEASEIVGRRPEFLAIGNHDAAFFSEIWQTISSGQAWVGNIRQRRKDGKCFWEHTTITAVHDEHGTVTNYLAVGEDITQQLSTQEQLAEAHKLSAVGTLAAGVAHEFRNYLGGIIGHASFVLEELDRCTDLAMVRETFTQVIDMAERANNIAVSLLSYSASAAAEKRDEDLKEIIGRTVRLVDMEMQSNWIEVTMNLEAVPPVRVSASRIQQLLLNLLINAREAIGRGGAITVNLRSRTGQAEIEVGDSGCGIKKECLGKVFDPFFSTKGVWGKDAAAGMGMGLSICRNIAREHGGDITVESIEGAGSTFKVALPLSRTEGSHQDGTAAATDRSWRKILLFTLNKTIAHRYQEDAQRLDVHIEAADNLVEVDGQLVGLADLVVGDAAFCGKLELYRLINQCKTGHLPYIVINGGTKDYQLDDIFDGAVAWYEGVPDLAVLLGVQPAPPQSVGNV